jgi:pyridoxal phosphate enzyme (YggS family)
LTTIGERARSLMAELPDYVDLVAAAKARTRREVLEAVDAGIRIVGENYIRDARLARELLGDRVRWHFIGRVRPHDIRTSNLSLFDMIESVDSLQVAQRIDERCATLGRAMPVLIEVNSGREPQKAGVWPEDAETLVRLAASLPNLKVVGLMTMGPLMSTRAGYRPCFAETNRIFRRLQELQIPGASMETLSMGKSDSYDVAIEEGSNMVRLGTELFGPH